MKKALLLLAIVIPLGCDAASYKEESHCYDVAGMYRAVRVLLKMNLSEKEIKDALKGVPNVAEWQVARAVAEVDKAGVYGLMSEDTLFKHVLLECKTGKKI